MDISVNLASLCRTCHDSLHAGRIKRRELLEKIARRERKTCEEIEEIIWRTLRA